MRKISRGEKLTEIDPHDIICARRSARIGSGKTFFADTLLGKIINFATNISREIFRSMISRRLVYAKYLAKLFRRQISKWDNRMRGYYFSRYPFDY